MRAGVDFFRVDRSGTTTKLLVSGVVLVTGGASAIGAHLMHRLPEGVSHLVSLAGGVAVIGGLVTAFGALAMMLFENVYMTIRDDGLLIHDNGKETARRSPSAGTPGRPRRTSAAASRRHGAGLPTAS